MNISEYSNSLYQDDELSKEARSFLDKLTYNDLESLQDHELLYWFDWLALDYLYAKFPALMKTKLDNITQNG